MSERSLTGVWHGLFSYPAMLEPGGFVATLLQTGAAFSGATHEPDLYGDSPEGTLFAAIDGVRRGSEISFTKSYDPASGWNHEVYYAGVLSADGDEIEGTWTIPGVWSGRFLMIRSTAWDEAAARKTFATA